MTSKKQVCQLSGLELPHRVSDLAELKKLAGNEEGCSVSVSYGIGSVARTSKVIYYEASEDIWEILHMMDDSEEQLTTDQLFEFTHIGDALDKSALFYEGC